VNPVCKRRTIINTHQGENSNREQMVLLSLLLPGEGTSILNPYKEHAFPSHMCDQLNSLSCSQEDGEEQGDPGYQQA
jgi:hypothetical protein